MLQALQIAMLMLVSIAMACSRAHALEFSGKDWTVLRDRWEYSDVARAVLSFVAMIMLACSIAVT